MSNEIERKLAPPNSIIFLADPTRPYDVPRQIGGKLVSSTRTCISVGTLAEMDGETTIRLGERIAHPVGQIVFSGVLETPGKEIAVIESGAEVLLAKAVSNVETRVTVWANDLSEPDVIMIEAR